MAEIAALSLAASILQVIDISVRVAERLNQYRKKGDSLPDVFKHVSTRLPIFVLALRDTNAKIEDMTDSARRAMKPAVDECFAQIKKLDTIIDKVLFKPGDTGATRGWKSVVSVKYDSDVKELDKVIRKYMEAMHYGLSSAIQNPEYKKLPPNPTTTCPFEREADFVERDVMNDVMTRCRPGTRLALMGIGGVGKSRIAIEYSYRIRNALPDTWVFWVSVETPITIAQDFRRIAKIVGIPGWDEKATDIFTLVRNWFKDESNGPWTMVLDNVDDAHVLTAPAPRVTSLVEDEHDVPVPQIREFFTTSSRGSILVTSRNTEAAQMITGNCAHHIDIEEMNETEAITLLKSKLNTRVIYTPSEASELVGAVDYMPLAISQIATNISINYPRLTLSKAIAQINAPSEDTARLLETSVHETSRDIRRSNSIVKTWHLSFQYVRETNPSAARLLSLMCLFDRQGIPEALLTGQYGEDITAVGAPLQPHLNWWKRIRRRRLRFRRRKRAGDLKTAAATTNTKGKNANFDNDWKVLTNFALIKTNIDGCHFNMHRLVQHTTKRWLEINGELRAWLTKYIHLIRDYFPARPDYDNWRLCQYLFPHAQQCIAYKPATDHEALNAWAPLMFSVATHANDIRNYKAAETLSRAVFELFNDSFGKENIQTLESAQQLGEALEHSQRHSEAEAMYKWTLAGRQKVLGQDHNVTLHTLNCLGRVLQAQNKMEEGDEVYKQRLDAKEKALGAADPSTQFSVSIAAFDFSSRGMFKEAEELQRKQIQNTCGKLSESDMYQMTTLASTLKMQAKYDEAETLYRRVLDERLEKGPNAAAFKIMVRIGELYEMQQRVSQAEEQYRQAAAAFAELCTPGHADTLETQERLALVLAQQQRYAEAEAFARHILLTRERAVGKQDRDTLIGAHTLAEILDQRGRYQDALPLFERAYVETEKLLGASHPDTIEFLNDYNRVKSKQQEWAQEYGDTCAGAEESHGQELGTDHLSTTESVNSVDIANDRQMNCVQEHDSVRGMEKTSFGQQQQQLGLVSPIMSAQPIAL